MCDSFTTVTLPLGPCALLCPRDSSSSDALERERLTSSTVRIDTAKVVVKSPKALRHQQEARTG